MDSFLFLRRQAALALILILGVILLPAISGAAAAITDDQARLLAGANATLTGFLGEGETAETVRIALRQAHGLLIFTNEGIDSGIGGWRGLLFGRDTGGSWTGPAVYTVISGTFGRSPADQVSQAMFIALTDVERLIAQRIRLGGSGISVARLAPGPLPAADLAADLAAVSNAAKANEDPQQAFAGTVLAPDQYATNALYGEPITIREAVASTADIGDDVVNFRLRLDAETTAP